MKKEVRVTGCYHSCPLFTTSMSGMHCNHPHWDDKGAYSNMIITQDNSRDGKIPEKCPLRKNELVVSYKLDKEKRGEDFEGVNYLLCSFKGQVDLYEPGESAEFHYGEYNKVKDSVIHYYGPNAEDLISEFERLVHPDGKWANEDIKRLFKKIKSETL